MIAKEINRIKRKEKRNHQNIISRKKWSQNIISTRLYLEFDKKNRELSVLEISLMPFVSSR